jgi:hypothetical protein
MRYRTKLLLTALITALMLLAATTMAHARRFELSNQRFRAVWNPETSPGSQRITFELPGFNIACRATIEGSFHSRTLSKVCGQLVGYVTSAAITRPCEVGEGWVQNGSEQLLNGARPTSLPWHIRYDRFTGTLPRIERIRLQFINVGLLVRVFVFPVNNGCLILTSAMNPVFAFVEIEAGGTVTGLRADEAPAIQTTTILENFCPEGHLVGRANVTLQGTTTKIAIRLVQ